MLQLEVSDKEFYDELKEEFIDVKGRTLKLEHSLISLSAWEAKWNVPFLQEKSLTQEKMSDYVRYMCIDKNIDDLLITSLSPQEIEKINSYIEAPMTATTFKTMGGPPNREIITAEIIYYWMIEYNIPFECQKWHLNRLLTLIRVCNVKNSPPKKMKKQEILQRNRALNDQRRRKMNSKG